MVGKRLSVVTLEQEGIALSDNYLKVEVAVPREPNRLIELAIGEVTPGGLREKVPFHILL
jgi:hypothetical protein